MEDKRYTCESCGRAINHKGNCLGCNIKNKKRVGKKEEIEVKSEIYDASKDGEFWSLHSNQKNLEPLKYSNGKTQEDIVKDISELVKNGRKVILLRGVCGTGKSSIALNLARLFGKTSIVVPVKGLQKQYERDYTNEKFLLKPNGKKMRISLITGRDNHDSVFKPCISCADPYLPDTILITEKNRDKLLEFYNENPFIENKITPNIKRLRRISIAPTNPYWSPIRSYEFPLPQLEDAEQKAYKGVSGKRYIFYHRKKGCSYYDQFQAYIDSDVIIFNDAKYEIEMAIGRKPETELDIIDEADSFLDNFSKDDSINLTRLANSLQSFFTDYTEAGLVADEIRELLSVEHKQKLALGIDESKIFPLNETHVGKILGLFLGNEALQAEIATDEQHYANKALETALMFEDLLNDTYVTYHKHENELYANLVTTNIAKRFAELRSKTKTLILMSGTLHSREVLKNVFGIEDFAIVEAETKTPGKITIQSHGKELDCRHSELKSGDGKRRQYLEALSLSVKNANLPCLVHVNAYEDLPTEQELNQYMIMNIPARESFRQSQKEDKTGKEIERFKMGEIKVLYSTKCSRGVDFPGKVCNSIVFTKYPNPNIQDVFWKVLKKTHSRHFWSFYRDKARREFLQRVYRALRSQDDHIYLLSPDVRVLNAAKLIQ